MSVIDRQDYLLEVGTEEIPARMAPPAVQSIARLLHKELVAARLAPESIEHFVTPRRMVVIARQVPVRQEDRVVEKRGPAKRIAFDSEGNPSKAGQGFARGQGIQVAELQIIEHNGEEYILARKAEKGADTAALLPAMVVGCLNRLRFPKSMRWGRQKDSFVRPVHWLLSLFGESVVPLSFAGISAGKLTRGHRFMGARKPVEVTSPQHYFAVMEQHQVVVSPDERRNRIQAAIAGVEADTGLSVIVDDALLEEVVHLVENPVISMGSFNEKFLDMPAEVLITSMKNHQKFFAVNDGDLLTNRFVVLNNTAARDPGLVVRGNERVLTARLEDALFFFNEDLKKPLEEYGKSLDGQTFLKGLGSMRDKSDRISRLAATIAEQLFSVETTDIARRAGKLAKADLATQMVFEFPELQGVMGREYARASNESDAVATAIFEHYLPAFAGDELPATEAGVALSLADRLDTVAGCFSLGLVPTATKDPYALRRAILGCLRIFAERRVTVSLVPLMEAAIDNYGSEMSARKHELIPAILGFVQGRLRNWLVEQHATEVVDACLASGIGIPFDVQEKCRIVESLRSRDDYEDLIQPFKRIINITRKEKTGAFLPDNLSDDAEKTLWDAFAQAEKQAEALLNERKFAEVLAIFIELKPAIDSYFEEVLVMCEDCDLRANRLAMLARIGELFLRVADFSKILV